MTRRDRSPLPRVRVKHLETRITPAHSFKIAALDTTNSAVVDHNYITDDDRGWIAVSNSHVLITGDSATARFNLDRQRRW